MTIFRSLPPTVGYDFPDHWRYVEWFTREWTPPSIEALRVAFHPPLFYVASAQLLRAGADAEIEVEIAGLLARRGRSLLL